MDRCRYVREPLSRQRAGCAHRARTGAGVTTTIVLFGLTGFGTAVLDALAQAEYLPALLVTRAEAGAHPYYPCANAAERAAELGIAVATAANAGDDASIEAQIASLKPDLLLCASYHRRITRTMRGQAGYAINLHPGLLPAYRGPTPTNWAIVNGESTTGVTAHVLDDELDAGAIYCVRTVQVPEGVTNGELRRELARVMGSLAADVVQLGGRGALPAPQPQDESQARVFPNIASAAPDISDRRSRERWRRALEPWPGLRGV